MLAMREKHVADHLTLLDQRPEIFVKETQLSLNEGEYPDGAAPWWFFDIQTL